MNVVHTGTEGAVVTAPADVIDDIITEVKNGTLVIHWNKKVNIKNPHRVDVDVTAIGVMRVKSSSGATVTTDTLRGENLIFTASSGAQINAMALAGRVTAESSSGSSVVLAGAARSVDFEVSSGARISGDKLKAADGNARVSSGGSITINAGSSLEAKASSGGSIRLRLNPLR